MEVHDFFSFTIIPRFPRVRRMNKNTLLEPSSGQQYQNCSTIGEDLPAMPHDVQGAGRIIRKQMTSQCLYREKKNTKQTLKQ